MLAAASLRVLIMGLRGGERGERGGCCSGPDANTRRSRSTWSTNQGGGPTSAHPGSMGPWTLVVQALLGPGSAGPARWVPPKMDQKFETLNAHFDSTLGPSVFNSVSPREVTAAASLGACSRRNRKAGFESSVAPSRGPFVAQCQAQAMGVG